MFDDLSEQVIAGCEGKLQFDSATLARKVAKRRARAGRRGEAYHCPFCRKWHIGRPNRLKRPK